MVFGSLFWSIGIALLSMVFLVVGARTAVIRIHKLLDHFGFSDTFGGLVIFSVSTSLPELFSHLVASLGILSGRLNYEVASATVLGGNIGSDVIQQTFIVGLVILLVGGLTFKKRFLERAYAPMIGTTLLCIILGLDGIYSRLDGAILVGGFILYMIFLYEGEEHHIKKGDDQEHILKMIIISILSLALIIVSAHFLLAASEEIVAATGLGGSLIGVVSLGVASASPELFTALFGIKENAEGISLGTLIGSNITNPLLGIGVGSLLSTYWVPRPLVLWDLPMETITAALLLVYLIKTDGKLGKKGALYLMGLYAFYLIIRILFFAVD